jgi:two-component system osmolarity sensor histidine kinase EnvZ
MVSVYFLSRWLVRPIDELRTAVGEMGMGEYPKPLPEKGPAEFTSLVHMFNWMVKSVQSITENRSTLLAGISHDLKTPLARMRLSVEMLSKEQDRELIEGVVDDLDVMDGMISEVLEYARGGRKGKREAVDINQVITSVVDRKQRGGANIAWAPSEPCVQPLDITALHRVLSNLIDNGNRYSGGQLINVSLQCGSDEVRIEIEDRGEGVPQEALEKVFQPFYRLEQSRSQDSGGNGLGLAIVKSLSSVNGWRVSLHNRESGGTLARVQIV